MTETILQPLQNTEQDNIQNLLYKSGRLKNLEKISRYQENISIFSYYYPTKISSGKIIDYVYLSHKSFPVDGILDESLIEEDDESTWIYVNVSKHTDFIKEVFDKIDSFNGLTDNWDDEGAIGISQATIDLAKRGIYNIENILNRMEINLKDVFDCIGPVSDGRIDFELYYKNRELNIIFDGQKPGDIYFIKLTETESEYTIYEGIQLYSQIEPLLKWLIIGG